MRAACVRRRRSQQEVSAAHTAQTLQHAACHDATFYDHLTRCSQEEGNHHDASRQTPVGSSECATARRAPVRLMVPAGTGEYRTNRPTKQAVSTLGHCSVGENGLSLRHHLLHNTSRSRPVLQPTALAPPRSARACGFVARAVEQQHLVRLAPIAGKPRMRFPTVRSCTRKHQGRPRHVRHARKPQTKGRRPYSRHSLRFWIRVAPQPRRRARLPHHRRQRQRLVRLERQLRVRRPHPSATLWRA